MKMMRVLINPIIVELLFSNFALFHVTQLFSFVLVHLH